MMIKENNLDGIELNITITSSDYDPTVITSGFLLANKIVPEEWIDGQQVLCDNKISQVLFHNRVNVISRRNRISFIESIYLETLSNVKSPAIALRYTNVLARLIDIKYLNIDISFQGYLSYPQYSDAPHRYIFEKLINQQIQEWTEIGGSNMQGSLSLFYSFTNREFKLSIDEGILRTSQGEASSVLLFTGHFNYKMDDNLSKTQETENCKVVVGWLNDLEIYQKIVNRLLCLS
jgi:hypothetical protein